MDLVRRERSFPFSHPVYKCPPLTDTSKPICFTQKELAHLRAGRERESLFPKQNWVKVPCLVFIVVNRVHEFSPQFSHINALHVSIVWLVLISHHTSHLRSPLLIRLNVPELSDGNNLATAAWMMEIQVRERRWKNKKTLLYCNWKWEILLCAAGTKT